MTHNMTVIEPPAPVASTLVAADSRRGGAVRLEDVMIGYKDTIGSNGFEWVHGTRAEVDAWGADVVITNRLAEQVRYADNSRVFGPDEQGYPGVNRYGFSRGCGFDLANQAPALTN